MDNFRYDPYLELYIDLSKHDAQTGEDFMSDDAHGHICTATGGAWRLDGRLFDGLDDKIVLPTSLATNLTEGGTWAAWLKAPFSSLVDGDMRIFNSDGAGSANEWRTFNKATLQFNLKSGTGSGFANAYPFGTGLPPDNTLIFIHYTWNWTGAQMDMTAGVNGVEKDTNSDLDAKLLVPANSIDIGEWNDTYMEMTMKYFFLWSRPLPITELQGIYLQVKEG